MATEQVYPTSFAKRGGAHYTTTVEEINEHFLAKSQAKAARSAQAAAPAGGAETAAGAMGVMARRRRQQHYITGPQFTI